MIGVGIRELSSPNWQPIETAPRDGTIILITNGRWVEATHWSASDTQFPWVTFDETIGINGRMEDSPTHWQPLPSAEAAVAGEREASLGVGGGGGQLFVHGSYEAIAALRKLLEGRQ